MIPIRQHLPGPVPEPVQPAPEPLAEVAEPLVVPDETGSIKGTLFDDKGRRVPFRLLIFTCLSDPPPLRKRRIVTTDDRGDYWLTKVPTGNWRASSAPKGFRSATFLAETEVWKDTVMPLDLFFRGSHVVSGNLTRESRGGGLEITLRDFYSGRAIAETIAVTLQPALTKQADPEHLQPRFLPGYFELGALPASKYVLSVFPSVQEFPEQLRRITKEIEMVIDLRVDDQVSIPPRTLTWEDFGLRNVVAGASGTDQGERNNQTDNIVGTGKATKPK